MSRFSVALLVSAALVSQAAFAQFSGSMSSSQLQQAIQSQVAEGKSAADIAKAALAAGVDASSLTTAMILAGIDPAVVIAAVIRAGGDAVVVMNAALGAGVSPTVVSDAAIGAGVNRGLVASTIARAGEMDRLARGFSGTTPVPGGPFGSGGGGTASTR